MNWTLELLRPFLISPPASDGQLVKGIHRLKEIFTTDRTSIDKYVDDPFLVSAYAAFYLPTNIPKLHFLLDHLPSSLLDLIRESAVIDVGSGPATYLLAMADYFEDFSGELVGLESSELMRKQGSKILQGLYPKLNSHMTSMMSVDDENRNRCLIFGHSLNEMGLELCIDIVQTTNADIVLMLEPGTPASFEAILDWRDKMAAHGYQILYPCSDINPRCPLKSVNEDYGDWCHQVLKLSHSSDIERLSQMAQMDRRTSPAILQAYCKKEFYPENFKPSPRLLRLKRETKFSFEVEVCHSCASGLCHRSYEVLKKHLTKKEQKSLKKSSWGINFAFEQVSNGRKVEQIKPYFSP